MFKKISIVVIALFLFGGSTFAFAWWDDLETSDDITIGVGEGVTLEDVAAADFGNDSLVPSGVIEQAGQTDSLSNTYTLDISSEDDITGDLEFNVTIDVTDAYSDEFDLEEYLVFTIDGEGDVTSHTISNFEDVFGEDVEYQGDIEIEVEFDSDLLDETISAESRDDIFNSDIMFDITFELLTD